MVKDELNIGENFSIKAQSLKKHFVALGSSGSGKTVLCKAIIEEAMRLNIPSILIDNQGDLSSMAIGNKNVKIYTPGSDVGIPISINPLVDMRLNDSDRVSVIDQVSLSICNLIGYDTNKSKGKMASALLYLVLSDSQIKTFQALAHAVKTPSENVIQKAQDFLSIKDELARNIRLLTIGKKELLFRAGDALDIGALLKNKVSVIYLNTLERSERMFFLSMLATELYSWMLKHPSDKLKAIFYIDEISEYLPAGSLNPITKPILRLLYKQARKFGIGCMISTQNPGDIDYKSFAQFGTWAIGRLTTKQDREKIKDVLNKDTDAINKVSDLRPGEFFIFSPDDLDSLTKIKVRWLYGTHKTLNEHGIRALTNNSEIKKNNAPKDSLPIKIADIDKLADKKRKGVFKKEQVSFIKLKFLPLYELIVRQLSGLLRKKLVEFNVIVDGTTGNIVDVTKKFTVLYDLADLIGLDKTALELLDWAPAEFTSEDVSKSLGIISPNKLLKRLSEKKLILASGKKKGKLIVWQKNIALQNVSLRPQDIKLVSNDGNRPRGKVSLKDVKVVLEFLLKGTVLEKKDIYYPYYEVKFEKDGISRVIRISAVNGKEF